MVQIKLSVAFILVAAAIAQVVALPTKTTPNKGAGDAGKKQLSSTSKQIRNPYTASASEAGAKAPPRRPPQAGQSTTVAEQDGSDPQPVQQDGSDPKPVQQDGRDAAPRRSKRLAKKQPASEGPQAEGSSSKS